MAGRWCSCRDQVLGARSKLWHLRVTGVRRLSCQHCSPLPGSASLARKLLHRHYTMGNWSGGCVGGRRGPVSALAIAICLAAGALATIDASGAGRYHSAIAHRLRRPPVHPLLPPPLPPPLLPLLTTSSATFHQAPAELELAGVATLFRYSKAWDDYAQPLAVLQVGQAATALHWVPAPREDAPPLYLLVGDAGGGLHVLSPSGRLAAQHQTGG